MKMEALQSIKQDVEEALEAPPITISTTCPYCGKEVGDNDDIILGNKDNPKRFDEKYCSDFVLIHINCAQKQNEV